MVDHPTGYLWSSYAVNSGMRSDPLISPHAEFAALAADAEKRHAAYRGFFEQHLDASLLDAIRKATNSGDPLASDAFKTNVLARLGWKTLCGEVAIRALTPNYASRA
jgi:putative transposase